ncbi:uncharacterized protein LOC106154615 [Lingula anatina]|uniref:Uncharacterized protein LOC106154615 n=1 Tax=Lingula anatina TaxID=7574 RepID=A0A1S3HEM3_LINAN|nr:uncharacterized protein LOC106154615 [Lingula anatina]|eukprot:XP_013384470.1 uncharacterized protein LOC106154615 [Lingula anatina]
MLQVLVFTGRCISTSARQCFRKNDYYIKGRRYPKKYWNTLERKYKKPHSTNFIEQKVNLNLPQPSVRAPYDRRYPLSGKSITPYTEGGNSKFPKLWSKITSVRGGSGVPEVGYRLPSGSFRKLQDSVPEFIVPDLKGFPLKPYVSYRVKDIHQEPLTAKNLFDACVRPDIERDFDQGNLDVDKYKLKKKEVDISDIDLGTIYKSPLA